jgi:hypothetical protein
MSKRPDGSNENAPYRHPCHRRPVTRREFLAQGFIGGAAMIAGPSLLGLFDTGGGLAGRIPIICVDLGGGANLAASNVMVGGPGGQSDFLGPNGYVSLGLPTPNLQPQVDPAQIDARLPLLFHADSALMRGIRAFAQATTLDFVDGAVMCARSDNDTGNNPHNPMYALARVGREGSLLTLIGTEPTESGGNSMSEPTFVDPAIRPTKIDRPGDATGLVDTGQLVQLLPNPEDAEAVMYAAEQISQDRVTHMNEQELAAGLITCSTTFVNGGTHEGPRNFTETTDLVAKFGSPVALDATLDVNIQNIIANQDPAPDGGNPLDFGDSEFRKMASVMKLVVNDFAGAATLEMGGYDYHGDTRSRGELKDFVAGQTVGAALEYANALQKPLALYIFSDGAVSSDGRIDTSQDGRNKGVWASDSSGSAASLFLVYDPLARPTLTRHQIGHYRSNGSVETGSSSSGQRIADNVVALSQAAVLNYLAMHGDEGMLDALLPGHILGSNWANLIAFSKLPSVT